VSRFLWRVKTAMVEENERYSTYLIVSFVKMGLFFGLFIAFSCYTEAVTDPSVLFDDYSK
jgi:hypothetical protein